MNTHSSPSDDQPQPAQLHETDAVDFDALEANANVEFTTTAGFLKRLTPQVKPDRPWGMENFRRFGKEVNGNADALGCLFRSAIDPAIGPVRVFPMPVLQRTYQQMAHSLGWPKIVERADREGQVQPELVSPSAAALEVKLALLAQLRMLASAAGKSDVRACARKLVGTLERECVALRAELAEPSQREAA